MAIQINTCGGERNFICNWLCIEILIEVCFNTVWLSFISVMYIVKLQIVYVLAQVFNWSGRELPVETVMPNVSYNGMCNARLSHLVCLDLTIKSTVFTHYEFLFPMIFINGDFFS